jgi:hypothetical protein
MPAAGTFRYVAIVPAKSLEERSSRWPVQLSETVDEIGHELHDARLIGHAPYLEITDGGLTPNPSPSRPAVLRSRFTLSASTRKNSGVASVSFHVDRDLTRIFEPGDRLHMTRTDLAGLGLSLLRNDQLVFAVGAISSVPLGNDVQAGIPGHLAREAETVFKKHDTEFRFHELPLQLSVRGHSRIKFRGWLELENYAIWLEHGYFPGMPGTNESAAIALKGACGAVPASASAQLLNSCELEMVRW